MNKAVIFGYYGSKNLGDETNLSQLVQYLKKISPELSVSVITANLMDTKEKLSIEVIPKLNFRKIFKELIDSDYLIGGGGTLFQDRSSLRSLLYYLSIIIMAKMAKTKIILYGQGIGPIKTWIGRMLAGQILSTIDTITVRDRLSIITLADLNIRKPDIYFTAEPLLYFEPKPDNLVLDFWEQQPIRLKKYKLGMILRETKEIKLDYWRKILEGLSWGKDIEIYLIVIDQKDLELNTYLASELDLNIFETTTDWEQLQLIVGGLDLVVSSRLHGLVAAVVQNVSAFGLAVDPKIDGFCLQIGISFILLTLDYDQLALINKITSLLEKLTGKRTNWLEQKDFWKVRAFENQTILKQFLNERS